jgi:hypothetical protein
MPAFPICHQSGYEAKTLKKKLEYNEDCDSTKCCDHKTFKEVRTHVDFVSIGQNQFNKTRK